MAENWRDDTVATLHRLCAHYGIATHYHDVWGHHKEVAPDALLALLSEFDPAANAPDALEGAWVRACEALWNQPLTPVVAIREGDAYWGVELCLPASTTALHWRLRDESGQELHAGAVDAHTLPPLADTTRSGVVWCRRHLPLNLPLAPAYYRLQIDGLASTEPPQALVICAPQRCYRPAAVRDGARVWGLSIQLYTLRSHGNWGIGDFGDLAQLVRLMAARGADMIGLNPMHALFTHNPAHASPYSPSSRRAINVLYIAVEAVTEFAHCTAARQRVATLDFQQRLARLRQAPLVDYPGVACAKLEVLQLLHAHFAQHHLAPDGSARDAHGQDFVDFVGAGGEALRCHALFEAIQARFHAADPLVWGWPMWPADWRDPRGDTVARFARDNADQVRFHLYLQWLATRQLTQVLHSCRALGMGVGLYLDLAVSVDRAGSDAWSAQDAFAVSACVGAPPDEFNPNGQGWGLPPLRPDRVRQHHYDLFIDTLRSAMRISGALRIDHVMGLMRLYWIPGGGSARDGAYVHYALHEMLAIVTLESQRNRCMVIGEDLGTVEDGVREALARQDVLSYRLLYFERSGDGSFTPPQHYPAAALAAVSTHDLATLAGWWSSHDLQQRLRLGLYPHEALFERQLADRSQERVRLLLDLRHAGLLTAEAVAAAAGSTQLPPSVLQAVHAHLASAPSAVLMVQLEDLLSMLDQVNIPATVDAHPNWRRVLPISVAELEHHAALDTLARTLSTIRPRQRPRDAATQAPSQARIPRATYRLQFHKDFGFDAATQIVPYLAGLGVSHVYCSPIHRARAGSSHGYDVVAHDEINPELGGAPAFARFCEALATHGMGQLLDLVPNHMGVLGGDNAWWNDVLENGASSLYAHYFDIEWEPLNPQLRGKVLLPVLGNHYGEVLMAGELVVSFDAAGGSLALHYHEHHFPLAPESFARLLQPALGRLQDPDLAASLASISAAFGQLPSRDASDIPARQARARDKDMLKARLGRLATRHDEVALAITAAVADMNVDLSRDALHQLIEAQAYRLAYWRVAADEINYRRFFDINDLAALRMEREDVFEATQSMALDLAARGVIDGLRIDHPDGLYDPAQYFARLQQGYAHRVGLLPGQPDAQGRPPRPLYVVAEKITAAHEELALDWAIHGTTGYRFAHVAGGVLIDTDAAQRFAHIWRNFTGQAHTAEQVAHDGKRDTMRLALASELQVLSTELMRIAHADRRTRDYTHNALRRTLAEVVACMPVYRSYIREQPSEQDRRTIDWAVTDARQHSRDADPSIYDFVGQCLLGRAIPGADPALCEQVLRFAQRVQQFSAPVAAKGVEDTAFYRYFPLCSVNEVGGTLGSFGVPLADFHAANADRALHWPHTMLTTSTHDNKRSEDVRCRMHVLSEMPARWRLALRRWRQMHRDLRSDPHQPGQATHAPSRSDEYLLYQTLLGTLPADGLSGSEHAAYVARIVAYMIKAAREAKLHTRWTQPDAAYEDALTRFIESALRPGAHNGFLADLTALTSTVAWFGALNSLTLALLKLSCPGVPDLYQGMEALQWTLVDPDNRAPVDYARLARMLAQLQACVPATSASLLANPLDGRAKMWITWRMLALRRQHEDLMRDGDYNAVAAHGPAAAHVIAFTRRLDQRALVVLAPRLTARLMDHQPLLPLGPGPWADTWVDTHLPDGQRLTHVLTGEHIQLQDGRIMLSQALAAWPMAAWLTEP